MKKILITGANSYIGTSFERYMRQWPEDYQIDTIDMTDSAWREKNFAGYDTVFHVAGIAHQKETKRNQELYYKVNRDLAIETAKIAKGQGVSQFIFLSSMSIYGKEEGVIEKDTIPTPKSNYGKSKYEAELAISQLQSDTFRVAVLRPPMVYGKGCKGNFRTLVKIAEKLKIFPNYENQRSMIYIENLCNFVKLVTDYMLEGLLFPQNSDYVGTKRIVEIIAACNKKRIKLLKGVSPFIILGKKVNRNMRKAFGNLIYKDTEIYDFKYATVGLEESVIKSAGK